VSADAGFFSARNEANAHERGVGRAVIPSFGTKSTHRRAVQKKRWFRNAQKRCTGREGRISLLGAATG
jgi:IS5 family transposase